MCTGFFCSEILKATRNLEVGGAPPPCLEKHVRKAFGRASDAVPSGYDNEGMHGWLDVEICHRGRNSARRTFSILYNTKNKKLTRVRLKRARIQ